MAVLRSLVALAILVLFSAPVYVTALAADRAQVARHIHAHHDAMAKRKRADAGSCVPRPSSAAPTSSSPTPTPSPSPSTTSSSPAPSSSSGSTSKKWGLAWPNGDQWLANFATLPGVQYIHTWSPEIPATAASFNLTTMPMLWGYKQVADFEQTVVGSYAHYALGPNEPNEPLTSMTPQQAVDLWMSDINHLKDQGYTLVSPACTDDDDGLAWYKEFFALCVGCQIDRLAFHAYTTSAQHLIDYATQLYQTYGFRILITEFADQNFSGTGGQADMDEIWDYAGQVKSFVENTPWIDAAFPFGAMQDLQGVNTLNSLMDANGNPTSLAMFYFD